MVSALAERLQEEQKARKDLEEQVKELKEINNEITKRLDGIE